MRGLLYNLLAKAARTPGCESEAWDLAAAVGTLAADLLTESLELEAPDGRLPPLACGGETTFRRLARSVVPFDEADWDDLPGVPVALGPSGTPRRGE